MFIKLISHHLHVHVLLFRKIHCKLQLLKKQIIYTRNICSILRTIAKIIQSFLKMFQWSELYSPYFSSWHVFCEFIFLTVLLILSHLISLVNNVVSLLWVFGQIFVEQCEAVPLADTESHGALLTLPLGLHSPPTVGRHTDRPTIHAGPLVVPTSGESFCHVHLAPFVSL